MMKKMNQIWKKSMDLNAKSVMENMEVQKNG